MGFKVSTRFSSAIFPLQVSKRVYRWAITLTLLPTLILAMIIPVFTVKMIKSERQKQLYGVVDRLRSQMTIGYDDILNDLGATQKNKEAKVLTLNYALQPFVTQTARAFPDLDIGFYSKDLDSVLAIYPEIVPFTTLKLPHEMPHFKVYQTLKPESGENNNSISWKGEADMWYASPIFHDGRVIGHLWADVRIKTIYTETAVIVFTIMSAWLVFLLLLLWASGRLFGDIKKDLENFSRSLIEGREIPAAILPELLPVQNLLKDHYLKLGLSQQIIESSPDAVYSASIEGTILTWNPGAEAVFGYSASEAVGQNIDLMIPADRKGENEENHLKVSRGETIKHFGTTRVKKDGTPVAVSLSMSPVLDSQGEMVKGYAAIARDVTEKQRLEKEMARLGRLDLIGEMAAGIGHEVRNPMTTVRGFLQILGEKEESDQKKEYYRIMIEELDRANSIISEYLDLARNKPVIKELCSLNKIVSTLLPLMSAEALKQDKQLLFEEQELPFTFIDEKEVRQLILNLVRNALEVTLPGGSVIIKTYSEPDSAVLTVSDHGAGIGLDVLEKLGTPFFTTKEKGTGLGLAVCYSIARRHDARIDVQTGSKGTTFLVKFKLAQTKKA